MNEPKKRGRPSKAEIAARQSLTAEVTEDVAGFERAPFVALPAAIPDDEPRPVLDAQKIAAQAYALRVWNGQSPDVPRNERLRRVAKALEGQGMSMEGVEL